MPLKKEIYAISIATESGDDYAEVWNTTLHPTINNFIQNLKNFYPEDFGYLRIRASSRNMDSKLYAKFCDKLLEIQEDHLTELFEKETLA